MNTEDLFKVAHIVKQQVPSVDAWQARIINIEEESRSVRQDILQPVTTEDDMGIMITLGIGGGMGYAATSDLSLTGISSAMKQAKYWAEICQHKKLFDARSLPLMQHSGQYQTNTIQNWKDRSISDSIEQLYQISKQLKISDLIVDWSAALGWKRTKSLIINQAGSEILQQREQILPHISATANKGAETQSRCLGHEMSGQGGLEQLQRLGFPDKAKSLANEAIVLLDADNCPNGTLDLLLSPGQMVLQIHESIGHPLELDRILGDERNYAGTSFVTEEMFGQYEYGSPLLNITFDPTHNEQLASYGYDDDGQLAEKQFIIKEGILQRPLGGQTSQLRANLSGVANARACHWNRPAIDRMANLNLEAGTSSFEELVSSIENGVLMDTNKSWSIDDSRNKFQFGCEMGYLIKNGELSKVVKNPNYRGISANFWRNLKGVGHQKATQYLGTPNCGKGEPNQLIEVGHAAPPCHFSNVEVFGGAK